MRHFFVKYLCIAFPVAPEMLAFEPVLPGSDMWTVGVLTYCM